MSPTSFERDEFAVEVRTHPGVDHVVVRGELDLSTASTLRQVVLDPAVCSQPVLLVDLEHTRFIDSSGVAGLVVAHRKTTTRGGDFVIACPDGFALQVLDLVGLPQVLRIVADASTFLKALHCDDQVCNPEEPGTMHTRGSAHLNR